MDLFRTDHGPPSPQGARRNENSQRSYVSTQSSVYRGTGRGRDRSNSNNNRGRGGFNSTGRSSLIHFLMILGLKQF